MANEDTNAQNRYNLSADQFANTKLDRAGLLKMDSVKVQLMRQEMTDKQAQDSIQDQSNPFNSVLAGTAVDKSGHKVTIMPLQESGYCSTLQSSQDRNTQIDRLLSNPAPAAPFSASAFSCPA